MIQAVRLQLALLAQTAKRRLGAESARQCDKLPPGVSIGIRDACFALGAE
ncbi:hypothetical protein M0D69_24715 [Caballeronia sp. SEWSISQ10-4 2]|nr:hypothetical protein [Caballeronia sp. SEWSISQ10-4 2]MDN7181136.1 hypothetical protein [Caballeronia sp. SEWSISQ10-4 2]